MTDFHRRMMNVQGAESGGKEMRMDRALKYLDRLGDCFCSGVAWGAGFGAGLGLMLALGRLAQLLP